MYVDGFNLYYRAVKGTPYRWLDIGKLTQLLLPKHQINRIRYFTALVVARPDDPSQPQRQQTYLRALGTIPNLTLHLGYFLSHPSPKLLVNPPRNGPRFVEVWDTEEKGSDVNLASYLLLDGFANDYEMAVVVSNDSDLQLPVSMVKTTLRKTVGVIDPNPRRSFELSSAASWYRHLRKGPLSASQFPPTLNDAQGIISKPPTW
ncbi:MAG: NYN domain-containing protein [Dehalococcoidia bacterium]|nr:NYN domain-containing protein [Dehalococcoidia bacterium]